MAHEGSPFYHANLPGGLGMVSAVDAAGNEQIATFTDTYRA